MSNRDRQLDKRGVLYYLSKEGLTDLAAQVKAALKGIGKKKSKKRRKKK
jgi:hypothetical protein